MLCYALNFHVEEMKCRSWRWSGFRGLPLGPFAVFVCRLDMSLGEVRRTTPSDREDIPISGLPLFRVLISEVLDELFRTPSLSAQRAPRLGWHSICFFREIGRAHLLRRTRVVS
jgi:hypothetical protein